MKNPNIEFIKKLLSSEGIYFVGSTDKLPEPLSKEDEIKYVLETPNHNTGNLITNLAKICGVETIKDENDMKIITGTICASINSDNEEVYIFRLGGMKIANIYEVIYEQGKFRVALNRSPSTVS